MARLKTEPMEQVTDLGAVRRVADALAGTAAGLYRRLAIRASELKREEAAWVFAELESLHRDQVGAASSGTEPAEPGPDLRTPVLEDEGLGEDRNVGAYQAWALAARNSERVFAYWSYISARTADRAVRAEAERLADVADALARRFRAERRRAYHAMRPEQHRRLPVDSLPAFATAAAREEAALSAVHRAIARELGTRASAAADLLAQLADDEAAAARDLAPGVEIPPPGPELPGDPDDLRRLARARVERVLELYLLAGETARDEEVLGLAQRLADTKLRAIAGLG